MDVLIRFLESNISIIPKHTSRNLINLKSQHVLELSMIMWNFPTTIKKKTAPTWNNKNLNNYKVLLHNNRMIYLKFYNHTGMNKLK